MKICSLNIYNFKSIRALTITEIENALILVGKNSTGKTVVIDALRIVSGDYIVREADYLDKEKPISILVKVAITKDDLMLIYNKESINKSEKYEVWQKDFQSKFPSYINGILTFECIVNTEGKIQYSDGITSHNKYIKEIFPKIYYIDHTRNLDAIQNEIFQFYDQEHMQLLQKNHCMLDYVRECQHCFHCIPTIYNKSTEQLTVFEIGKLLEYKLFHLNLNEFSDKVNKYFHANGTPSQDIRYEVAFHLYDIFKIETKVYNKNRNTKGSIHMLSEGFRSIYAFSFLEAYIEDQNIIPSIIAIEDPEIYLHPQLQKIASEILVRLSKKNQIIFSTHSPNLIFNFSSKQIKQVVLDEEYYTTVNENVDIDDILDNLGYTANDLMNVNFVFIVEGKQDSNRLPLLLEKYYSEIYDESGNLQRITIIPTNSCTNIKTYANLKYINKLYLKDQFLMIRDSDGKNPNYLIKQLCSYYTQRAKEDVDNIPRVQPRNILILKYYSFENYFLDSSTMTKIGVVKSEEDFYNILFKKYKDYLYKLSSTKRMIKNTGIRITNKQDLKENIELIKTYVRGHNLFDIFYGKYRGSAEQEILKRYIDIAPKEVFKDIFDAIDSFIYFENRKK